MGPPRYLIVSGAKVSGFKHRMPDYGEPGSFSIQAETVAPVASASNTSASIDSTFGITIEMGGERFYEGAIFETNVINLDVDSAEFASPWDMVAAFKIDGVPGIDTAVRALLPRSLLSGQFMIMDPSQVKAAVVESNGSLSYVTGSISGGGAGDETFVGSAFARKPYKGHEPTMNEPGAYFDPTTSEGAAFLLNDSEFGIAANSVSYTHLTLPTILLV